MFASIQSASLNIATAKTEQNFGHNWRFCFQAQSAGGGAGGGGGALGARESDSDDEVPDLVDTFDENA
jgi:hypothetical protein